MFGPVPDELRKTNIVLSASKLICFRENPQLYYWTYILGNKATSKQMDTGILLHAAVLEPQKIADQYCTVQGYQAYSKDELRAKCLDLGITYKDSWTKDKLCTLIRDAEADFMTLEERKAELQASGKIVITPYEEAMLGMVEKHVAETKISSKFLATAQKETRGWFQYAPGIIISFVVDAHGEYHGKGVLCDVKTTQDISARKVMNTNYWEGRHIQLAIYADGLKATTGLDYDDMAYLLFIEQTAPWSVAEYSISPGMLDAGRSEYRVLIREIVECIKTNKWPGPQKEIEATDISEWDYQRVKLDEETVGI